MLLLKEKVFGCLMGGAIGNAMGSPVEGMNYWEIEKKYGRITTVLDPSRIKMEDDTSMVLLLCKAYIEKEGRVNSDDLARMWLREMDPKRYFWCIRNAYELIKRGIPPRVVGSFNLNTGSAIMAISPVGIYNACDPETAFQDAREIAYMYQPQLDADCACIVAVAIAEAMKIRATVRSIIDRALKFAPREPYIAFDDRVPNNIHDTLEKALEIAYRHEDIFEVREELYRNALQWHPIDPLEVLSLVLALLYVTGGDVRDAITAGVNIGRDADTIANLLGAISCTINGFSSIPDEWVNAIDPEVVEHFEYIADRMISLIRMRMEDARTQIRDLDIMLDESHV